MDSALASAAQSHVERQGLFLAHQDARSSAPASGLAITETCNPSAAMASPTGLPPREATRSIFCSTELDDDAEQHEDLQQRYQHLFGFVLIISIH